MNNLREEEKSLMLQGEKILALVPARGGSKGIKNKNIISVCKKPLIAYTLEAAQKSKYIDKIVVSTDSSRIAKVAMQYGGEVPFMRPAELAQDSTKSIDVMIHVLDSLVSRKEFYDIVILLQPTQPLRTEEDIDGALELFMKRGKKSIVSVCEVEEHPLLTRKINGNGELISLLDEKSTVRRQEMASYYRVNGCIYINQIKELNQNTSLNDNKIPYIMPKERSVDIDEWKDIVMAEYYLSGNTEK